MNYRDEKYEVIHMRKRADAYKLAMQFAVEAAENPREFLHAYLGNHEEAFDAVAQWAKSHASDCALHNSPAYPPGPCDCGKSKHA